MSRRRPGTKPNPTAERQNEAIASVFTHPLFAPMRGAVRLSRSAGVSEMATVDRFGHIELSSTHPASSDEWVWAIAHLCLHLGMGHFDRGDDGEGPGALEHERAWSAACCVNVNRLLTHLKIGTVPEWARVELPDGDEERLFTRFVAQGVPMGLTRIGPDPVDLRAGPKRPYRKPEGFGALYAQGLNDAVSAAMSVAAGERASVRDRIDPATAWRRALSWFKNSYPLLGGVAAGLVLVEDARVCTDLDIDVAAVAPAAGELYVNPRVGLGDTERVFVIGHELLHAALRHDARTGGRDPLLFNLACDYVINGWLVEMQVGAMPEGLLYDPSLKGLSSEEVYDRICGDLRRLRRASSFRGRGRGDVLGHRDPLGNERTGGVGLDELYRRALVEGHDRHQAAGRGFLPAGLVAEIRSLSQPPVPWDVELGHWFEEHFCAEAAVRTYARASRRQASTPDIPRPGRLHPTQDRWARTFGVVLDTSGSMGVLLMGKALGAIAAYAAAHEVRGARVVFCDAAPYDAGYLSVDEVAGRVQVKGRGGTVLQPAVDLLERADDFPNDAPILIITDGACDRLRIRRSHAYLLPRGNRLPYPPKGPIFYVK